MLTTLIKIIAGLALLFVALSLVVGSIILIAAITGLISNAVDKRKRERNAKQR